ncbi:MAG: 3-deoxy-8-phosphooctulonate synthase [Holosporales bacterium]|jgi:2-dehydro-3-deoxyphosphooctonate aldolase (KDO 8-P synthase)|nr:3-deoxy-8-phosphooctulonate synthase [Holosporales bacterium]
MNTSTIKAVTIGGFEIANDRPFVFIGGPCVIESLDHSLAMCCKIGVVCERLGVSHIFKSSFDKANRTSISGERGVGIDEGLRILEKVKSEFGVPVLTDVHLPDQCDVVAEVADVLQIPAFLCRQTDLLKAAAKTGRVINVKKGQFVAPADMASVVEKLRCFGATDIMLCDRGTCFGYNALVTDFRGIPIMAQTGCPVIFDATHSVQMPSANGASSGGERKFAPILARAAVAVGVAGVFMEVHDDPDNAPCDGPNMIHIDDLEQVLTELIAIDTVSKKIQRTI